MRNLKLLSKPVPIFISNRDVEKWQLCRDECRVEVRKKGEDKRRKRGKNGRGKGNGKQQRM